MTEVRDWQEDMKMMEGTFEFDWTNNQDLQIAMGEALPYWLKQYKELEQTLIQTTASLVNAEAEREDIEAWKEEAAIQAQLYLESEEREKKLLEAINEAMNEEWRLAGEPTPVYNILHQALSLYPIDKEEEAK